MTETTSDKMPKSQKAASEEHYYSYSPPSFQSMDPEGESHQDDDLLKEIIETHHIDFIDHSRSEISRKCSSGSIWKVFDTESQQWSKLQMCTFPQEIKNGEAQVEFFRSLRSLNDPASRRARACLPSVYREHFDTKSSHWYLLMDYLNETDLQRFFISDLSVPAHCLYSNTSALRNQFTDTIIVQLLMTLQFLHSRGIVHGNIAPTSISFITPPNIPGNPVIGFEDNRPKCALNTLLVKLGGFEHTKLASSGVETGGVVHHNNTSSAGQDLFDLGITALTFLFGYSPGCSTPERSRTIDHIRQTSTLGDYEQEYAEMYKKHLVDLRSKGEKKAHTKRQLSPQLRQILSTLLDHDPEKRFEVYNMEWYQQNSSILERELDEYLAFCDNKETSSPVRPITTAQVQ